MNIQLCITTDDKKKIRKNISVISEVECVIKNDTNIISPIIIINYNENYVDCNYAYIEEFNRYYYINSKNVGVGGKIVLYLKVDVLMSFADELLIIPALVDKQEQNSIADKYLNDGSFLATQKEFIRCYEFANGFNDEGTYILIACGG